MLAVSPLRNPTSDENKAGGRNETTDQTTCEFTINHEEFPEFADHENILETIGFDELFTSFNYGDVLPDLEIDPDILTDFSDQMNTSSVTTEKIEENNGSVNGASKEEGDKGNFGKGEEVVSKRDDRQQEAEVITAPNTKESLDNKKRKHSSAHGKLNNKDNNSHNQEKRKVKVDWTPELHRRFVQAVEQLGVDKAVPSRILELMGIDCLTRHNVASHLQKYRSHRKHLLAREAEAASWTQKRQIYGVAGGGKKGGGWLAPTIGFPPPAATLAPPMHHRYHHHPHFRPLHVWGHPTVDQPMMAHMWPKHSPHSLSPPSPVAPPSVWAPPPPTNPSYWHHRVQNGLTPGTPCFPQPLAGTTRFNAPAVHGIPPQPHLAVYKVDPGIGLPTGPSGPPPPIDLHPSKESVDAAIGDVITKPWLPLPLGLKPPSIDSVMVELHRQGISNVPPNPSQ